MIFSTRINTFVNNIIKCYTTSNPGVGIKGQKSQVLRLVFTVVVHKLAHNNYYDHLPLLKCVHSSRLKSYVIESSET